MVKRLILEIICNITGIEDPADIKLNMSLRDHLNMDEGEIDTLFEAAEAELDVDLFAYAPELDTVGDVIAFVKSQL